MYESDRVAEQAADWLVALTDDTQDRASLLQQYQQWRQADPRHDAAARNMETFLDRLDTFNDFGVDKSSLIDAGLTAGMKGRKQRRYPSISLSIFVLLSAVLPGWAVWQLNLPGYLLADIRTANGEWYQRALTDGSRISLSSRSAVDIEYDPLKRRVSLIIGEIHVDVAKDSKRPFVIETRHGQIEALGTRFIVRTDGQQTQLSMIESSASISNQYHEKIIHAGQQLTFDEQTLGDVSDINPAAIERAWQSKILMVENMSLANVLYELDRYRQGKLMFSDAALARLSISAVLPLDDTDKALRLLQDCYPQLAVHQLGSYLTYISIKEKN